MSERETKLVVGCGYVGHRVASQWRDVGHHVTVMTRSIERARSLSYKGFETIVADVTRPATLAHLPIAKTVLFSVGFDCHQPHSISDVYVDGLKNVLDALPAETARVIYISSTGVYGDAAGDWVDEETPPRPSREGGHASLAAEQQLFAHSLGDRGIVLRLAGIYGPDRVPRREDLVAGKAIPGNPDGVLNLVHIDDAVQAIHAAELCDSPPRIFNVADSNPAPRRDYYQELSRLLDVPPPKFAPSKEYGSERARGTADKRVRNTRMLIELSIKLHYPSFREGLAAIVSRPREPSGA